MGGMVMTNPADPLGLRERIKQILDVGKSVFDDSELSGSVHILHTEDIDNIMAAFRTFIQEEIIGEDEKCPADHHAYLIGACERKEINEFRAEQRATLLAKLGEKK